MNKRFVARVLCLMIILHKWAILVGCLTEAKLWLISKTISKDKTNHSLQCGLATKQLQKSIAWKVYALKDNKKCFMVDDLPCVRYLWKYWTLMIGDEEAFVEVWKRRGKNLCDIWDFVNMFHRILWMLEVWRVRVLVVASIFVLVLWLTEAIFFVNWSPIFSSHSYLALKSVSLLRPN